MVELVFKNCKIKMPERCRNYLAEGVCAFVRKDRKCFKKKSKNANKGRKRG